MKVLVQDVITLSYFQSPQSWTSEPEEAFVFEDSHAAVQFCLANDLENAQVVLKFEDERYDVQLPVSETERYQASEPVVL